LLEKTISCDSYAFDNFLRVGIAAKVSPNAGVSMHIATCFDIYLYSS